jgi:hypothetical protein
VGPSCQPLFFHHSPPLALLQVCELSALLDEWRTEAVAAAQSSVDSWRLAQSAQDLAHQRMLDLQEAEAKLAWAEDVLGGADGHVAELQAELKEMQRWLEEEQDNSREARLHLQAELDEVSRGVRRQS